MGFEQAIKGFAPGYFQQQNIGTLLEAVGQTYNEQAERVFLGRTAGIPLAGGATTADGLPLQCEPDALPYHARDRGLRLYATEPLQSKRVRLARWRQLHARRGTHLGELEHVQPYFLGADGTGVIPKMRIVHTAGDGSGSTWHTLAPDGTYSVHMNTGSNWNFDGHFSWWSRWWAIIYTTGTVLDVGPTTYDDGSVYDGGQVYDGIAPEVAAALIAMFLDWKGAGSQLAGVILARDPASFDPTASAVTLADGSTSLPIGNWGKLVDPSTGLQTRPSSASWIYDRYYQ